MRFIQSDLNTLQMNPFSSLKNDWALVTAGDKYNLNTMTVSWGGMGVIWQKNVTFVFIRPQRYTFEFVEKNDFYSLSFLEKGNRNILSLCGSKSGRDIDKIKETGLIPIFSSNAPYFEQSRLVFICRKLHGQFIDPSCFIDDRINSEYPNKDYHKMFVGEIVECLTKSEN